MAVVKIFLEGNETEEEAKEMLLKALTSQESGELHQETFRQPAVRDVYEQMDAAHQNMWSKMLEEISQVLDSEC